MNQLVDPIVRRMTLSEFLVWNAPGPCRWQLIDGEALEMAPTAWLHGAVHAEFIRLLGNHLVAVGGAWRVIAAPGVVPMVRPEINFRIPDIGVTREPVSDRQMIGTPCLLAEILSPSNEAETRLNIEAFKTIPSVAEILLLRSSRIEGELFRRRSDGTWPAKPALLEADATLTLSSIGFTIPLAALHRTTGL